MRMLIPQGVLAVLSFVLNPPMVQNTPLRHTQRARCVGYKTGAEKTASGIYAPTAMYVFDDGTAQKECLGHHLTVFPTGLDARKYVWSEFDKTQPELRCLDEDRQ